MKKISIILSSIVALSAAFIAPSAIAVPGNTSVRLDCPDITNHGTEKVTNFGSYLSGPGIERVGANASTFPIFSGLMQAGLNIPMDLVAGGYFNNGTSYNSNSGVVTCYYATTQGLSPFQLTYQLNNAIGGIVTKSSAEELNLMLQVGATKA